MSSASDCGSRRKLQPHCHPRPQRKSGRAVALGSKVFTLARISCVQRFIYAIVESQICNGAQRLRSIYGSGCKFSHSVATENLPNMLPARRQQSRVWHSPAVLRAGHVQWTYRHNFQLNVCACNMVVLGQGFVYAVSQFVVAKPVIAWSASRGEWASLRVLLSCLVCMASGRLLSFYTLTIELVGVGLIMVILSLGVLNTFLSTRYVHPCCRNLWLR